MENSKLLIYKRFQRRVVQIRSSRRIPSIPHLVNLPLTYNANIGFEYEKNIISVSDIVHHHHRTQPKILFVQKTCNCSNHSQHEENVIIVLTVTECRELYVKNISCGTSYRLTHTCNAIFSTDYDKAIISLSDLPDFPEDIMLPLKNSILQPGLNLDSPQR